MRLARAADALLVLALASACGGRPAVQAPPGTPAPPSATAAPPSATAAPPSATAAPPSVTAAPPTATVAPPSATVAPTNSLAGPTPGPSGEGLLPAELYIIDEASMQVFRVARDGRTATQITFEAAPVLELAVAAAGGLAYVIGSPDGADRALVALDGAGRRERLFGNISGLTISPDGEQLVYRLDDPEPGLIVGRADSPSGVWSSFPAGPGRPSLVMADEPADGGYDPDAPAWVYAPVAFSPDGASLALFAYDADGPAIPGGELAILSPGGEARGPACCEEPAWGADGATLHIAGGGPGPDVRYGLTMFDAATGRETALLSQRADGPVPLVTAPRQLADGALYAFVELAPADGFSWEYPFRPRLSRVGAGGAVAPLSPPVPWPAAVLWADDASGAAVASLAAEGALGPLTWVPADGTPPVALGAGVPVAWAPAGAPLAAGDCGAFAPVRYQEPGARAFDPAARDVQARLAALGYDLGAADGFYGERTRAAVAAFQRDSGLADTGDVDCRTWQALLGAL